VGLLAKAAVFSAAFAISAPALAQSRYNGSWAIAIMTERGSCDPLYRYYVDVEGQTVWLRSMTGATAQSAAGLVRPDGRINVTLGQADDPVSVKGRLGTATGAGTWAAPARGCTGRWNAAKRG
jgi:hypothetical protein